MQISPHLKSELKRMWNESELNIWGKLILAPIVILGIACIEVLYILFTKPKTQA